MSTLAEVKTRVISEMENRSDLDTGGESADRLTEAIDSAIAFHADEQFWFNRASGSGATTAADATLAMPTGVRVPNVVAYLGNALQQVPLDTIEHRTETGIPTKWAENEDTIQLWPIPDGAYTVYVYGLATAVAPASASSNIWTTEAEDLIVATAKKRLYRIFRDVEGVALAAQEEDEALTKLRRESRRRGRANLISDLPIPSGFNIVTG